jgi:hypothetical protein
MSENETDKRIRSRKVKLDTAFKRELTVRKEQKAKGRIASPGILDYRTPTRSNEVAKAVEKVVKKTPDQFRADVKMDRDVQSAKLANARRTGVAQPPSEFSVGRRQAKGEGPSMAKRTLGAGLIKDIKIRMMKHIPGKLKKTY